MKTRLIALDGMVYHASTEISCPNCATRRDRAGKIHYYHATLLPLMVQPETEHVLTCFPEMITPQDGAEKQDCERNAAKRWLANWSHLFTPGSITYLGDDLFCNHPLCEQVIDQDQYFLFVCKPDSHVELYCWLAALTPNEQFQRRWNGRHGEIWRWRWVNQLPLRSGDDALLVNWCELLTTHEETGEIMYHNSWATNHTLHADNVEAVCTFGRTRWKIENEGINVLQRKGYNVEHNFGHGSQYLAPVLLVLNLLAFLLHTAMHLLDELYQFLRRALHTRLTFFNDLRALCRYNAFPNWESLWLFMIKSLEEDDVPPHIAALLSN
ncbi:MAG: ISNCY family transposase [Ardenticatenaceae bacterium]|nr:ISNCY family transposase [Ardenticatenaceae bacterium]